MAHGEHAVGDDAGEADHPGDVVVLMQRVLIASHVRVSAHLLAGHHSRERLDLIADAQLLERRKDGQFVFYRFRAEVMKAYLVEMGRRLGLGEPVQ